MQQKPGDEPLRYPVTRIEAPDHDFPDNKRPMAGRSAFAVTAGLGDSATILHWSGAPAINGPSRLRLVVAMDERVPHQLTVADPVSGQVYGTIDIFFGCPGQVFSLDLTAEQTVAAFRSGLALRIADPDSPLWLVAPGPNAPTAVVPHLVEQGGAPSLGRFLSLFCSEASFQPCDWMGVCVLDGLHDWEKAGVSDAGKILRHQLSGYFHPEFGRREGSRGNPCDGMPGGPESTGPFALLAIVSGANPHPALALAEQGFVKSHAPDTDTVGRTIVAETSYNIAYPMMALAVCCGKDEYYARAVRQLEVNKKYLARDDVLWLRYFPAKDEHMFRSWSRGVAWYFLGLVRTLLLLPPADRPPALVEEAQRMAAWVSRRRQQDGLWPCFFDEPQTLPDTSGSSGIAAAIALGVRGGMIDKCHLEVATTAYQTLFANYLDPDGWLRGASQSNKREAAEIDLQRSSTRFIAPWGMGLFAQLAASLNA